MPEIGDALLGPGADESWRSLVELRAFLAGTLIPHMEAAERSVYPELERMFQNRHSMAPMRREHEDVRRLVTGLDRVVDQDGHLTLGRALAARRVVFQLYALLKIHLAEEEAYLRIVEHGVSDDMGDVLAAAMEHPVAPTA